MTFYVGEIAGGPRDGERLAHAKDVIRIVDGQGDGYVLTTYVFDLDDKCWRIAFTQPLKPGERRRVL